LIFYYTVTFAEDDRTFLSISGSHSVGRVCFKKTAFKTGSNGQFYASFSVTFNWKLLDLSPDSTRFSFPARSGVQGAKT